MIRFRRIQNGSDTSCGRPEPAPPARVGAHLLYAEDRAGRHVLAVEGLGFQEGLAENLQP